MSTMNEDEPAVGRGAITTVRFVHQPVLVGRSRSGAVLGHSARGGVNGLRAESTDAGTRRRGRCEREGCRGESEDGGEGGDGKAHGEGCE
jgi:hypothetical protein